MIASKEEKILQKRHSSLEQIEKNRFTVMGVVNVTPDSFFDGGRYNIFQTAYDHANRLIDEGADILDIGGESSRPGANAVTEEEELKRVIPVIENVRKKTDIPISIDTTKASVAEKAILSGATWINDISAGRFDCEMAPLAAKQKCPVILMHSRKTPKVMQESPRYDNVVQEVSDELLASVNMFISLGVSEKNIILDPGIGFAKRFEDNIELIRNIKNLTDNGFPVCIGTSRKSFIGQITGRETECRLYGTLGSVAAAFIHGVKIFRVHDVKETKDFLNVFTTIEKS